MVWNLFSLCYDPQSDLKRTLQREAQRFRNCYPDLPRNDGGAGFHFILPKARNPLRDRPHVFARRPVLINSTAQLGTQTPCLPRPCPPRQDILQPFRIRTQTEEFRNRQKADVSIQDASQAIQRQQEMLMEARQISRQHAVTKQKEANEFTKAFNKIKQRRRHEESDGNSSARTGQVSPEPLSIQEKRPAKKLIMRSSVQTDVESVTPGFPDDPPQVANWTSPRIQTKPAKPPQKDDDTSSFSSPPILTQSSIADLYKWPQKAAANQSMTSISSFKSQESRQLYGQGGGGASFKSFSREYQSAGLVTGAVSRLDSLGSLGSPKTSDPGSSLPLRFPGTRIDSQTSKQSSENGFEKFRINLVRQKFDALVTNLRTKNKIINAQDVEFVNRKLEGSPRIPSGYYRIQGDGRSIYEMRAPDSSVAVEKGTYGIVYEGFYKGSRVAIKVPLDDEMGYSKEVSLDSLMHETEVLVQVPYHPNIVSLRGVCVPEETNEQKLWMILSFADGPDLASILAKPRAQLSRTISAAAVVNIIFNTADALAFLHEHGPLAMLGEQKPTIIHRDVKLENILLTADGPVLCDFGNAAAAYCVGDNPPIKAITWYYAPPELIQLSSPTYEFMGGPPWDAWSFGCTLLELLGYSHPFAHLVEDPTRQCDVQRCFRDALTNGTFIPRISRQIQEPLLNLILGLLHPEPHRRLTMRQFRDELAGDPNAYARALTNAIAF